MKNSFFIYNKIKILNKKPAQIAQHGLRKEHFKNFVLKLPFILEKEKNITRYKKYKKILNYIEEGVLLKEHVRINEIGRAFLEKPIISRKKNRKTGSTVSCCFESCMLAKNYKKSYVT